jgi:hypothetical protein
MFERVLREKNGCVGIESGVMVVCGRSGAKIQFVGSEVLSFDSLECECENIHCVMCNELY